MFGTIVSLTRRRLSLMLVVGLLTALLGAVSADAAAAQPASCSVSNADGGIDVSWQALDGAAEYVYRLEVPGENNRYRRVDATSTFIELADGDVGTVFVSAVFADGSYSPSVGCGSGQANDGTGGQPSTCSVANANGGIDATWSYVNGAVEYVYRLEVDGQDNRYQRVMGTSAFIPLNEGVVGTVFVSGVKADGSYTPAVACGSGQANEGTGGQNATCTSESADGGIRISWTAVPDASVYVYRLEVDGQNNRYGVFPADGDLTGVVQAPAGTVGTLFVSAKFANNTYSAGIACGTATAGEGGGGINAPAECSSIPAPAGADISWSPVANAASYVVYRTQYRTDELKEIPTTGTALYEALNLGLGTKSFWVAAVAADGSVSDQTSCGTVDPGAPNGPDCAVEQFGNYAAATWGNLDDYSTVYSVVNYSEGGGAEQSQSVFSSNYYAIPSDDVTSASVKLFITVGGPGGPQQLFTLASECTITDSGNPDFPAGPAECTMVESSNDGIGKIDVDWGAVDIPTLSQTQTARYELLLQVDNGGANFVHIEPISNRSFTSPEGQADLGQESPWVLYNGDVIRASVRAVITDTTSPSQQEGQSTDCGSVTISDGGDAGGVAEGPESCSVDGSTVTFSNPFNNIVRIRLQAFRAPALFSFNPGTSYDVQNVPSAAAATQVFAAKVDDFGVPSAEIRCGEIVLNG